MVKNKNKMKLTPKIQKAINFASRLHAGQARKDDDTMPYVSHAFSVGWILSEYTDDENVIAAGMLHDVLEDVKDYRFDDLKNDFGEEVAKIVKEVSEDKDPNIETDEKALWEERKAKYLKNLENDSFEGLMVCAADKIHNMRCLIKAYEEQGDELWGKFNAPADRKVWYYEEVYKILDNKLDNPIVGVLNTEIEKMKALLAEK